MDSTFQDPINSSTFSFDFKNGLDTELSEIDRGMVSAADPDICGFEPELLEMDSNANIMNFMEVRMSRYLEDLIRVN